VEEEQTLLAFTGYFGLDPVMPRKSQTENVRTICGCAKWKTIGGAM